MAYQLFMGHLMPKFDSFVYISIIREREGERERERERLFLFVNVWLQSYFLICSTAIFF